MSLLPLIGAGISGLFQASAQKDANRANQAIAEQNSRTQEAINNKNIQYQLDANAAALRDKEQDRQLQTAFAKQGVRWRAEDALAAGIHPLYELGGNFASYTPSSITVGAPRAEFTPQSANVQPASALASIGQNVGRALMATRTDTERDRAFNQTAQMLALEKGGLENELLKSQIAQMRGQIGPPLPGGNQTKPALLPGDVVPQDDVGAAPDLFWRGNRISLARGTSTMDDISKVLGDEGLPSWIGPMVISYEMLRQNSGGSQRKLINTMEDALYSLSSPGRAFSNYRPGTIGSGVSSDKDRWREWRY